MKKIGILLAIMVLMPASGLCIPFSVTFDPAQLWVNAGETFSVDLYADLPEAIISWDLNVSYDRDLFLFQGSKVGDLWEFGVFEEGVIGGINFVYGPVAGSDILLARLFFDVIGTVTEPVTSQISVDSDDTVVSDGKIIPRGFATPPDPSAALYGAAMPMFNTAESLYDIDRSGTEVTVAPVPEPSTLLLLGIGLIGAGMSTSRMRNKR